MYISSYKHGNSLVRLAATVERHGEQGCGFVCKKEVAKLQAMNLIEAVDNPAHKTSKLLRATKHGRSEYESRRQRYMQIYAEVEEEFSEEELEVASRLMDKLERVFRTAGDADRT